MLNQKGFITPLILILILIIGTLVGVYLVQNRTNLFPKAFDVITSNSTSEVKYINSEEIVSKYSLAKSQDATGVSANDQIAANMTPSNIPDEQKPNIIFIVTDDQNFRHLSIAGNEVLKTPHIDSLANPGVYFTNAYVPLGACSPSRASIWTSKLPHIHGVTAVGKILPEDQITLPEILKANGYNTGFFGKCHLGDPYSPTGYKRGFDYTLNITPDLGYVEDWHNYELLRNGKKEQHNEYITDYLTSQSLEFIKQKSDESKTTKKPFFLWLSHVSPHLPTTPPKNSNKYSLDKINLPLSISDDLSTKPPIQAVTRMHGNYLKNNEQSLKSSIKNTYEVLSNLDDNVGKINKTLQDLGIKDNTIIVYVSDNGFFYGEHQLWHKGPFFYEEQVKTPILISYPKLIKDKNTNNSLVSTMDLMPTILNILNISNPPNIQGKSLLGLLTNQSSNPVHKSLYLEMPKTDLTACSQYPMVGIVMDGFKWVHYIEGTYSTNQKWDSCLPTPFNTYDGYDYELYDLKNDPYEMNNLMKRINPQDNPSERLLTDPTYGKVVQKIRKERAIWAIDTKDPKAFVLTEGKVTPKSSTSLEVSWKVSSGNPTAEIEYQEKDCSTCPVMQLDDFGHHARPYTYTLSNLKPNTTYAIKVFSFGRRGVGGYLNLEGTTNTSANINTNGCSSDSQCRSDQICQQTCTASFPAVCKGVCFVKQFSTPTPSPIINTGSGISCASNNECPSGQSCQQICTTSYPYTCKSLCNPVIPTPSISQGNNAGGSP